MAPPYKRGFSFTSFQANQPRASLPGQRVDIELDEIAGVLTGFGTVIDSIRPLPARSLAVNLTNTPGFPQPITIDAFKIVLGLNLLQPALGFVPENAARKGVAGGYAPLGADGKVPTVNLDLSALQPVLNFTPENRANRGAANGYAPLDATGRVPLANLPDLGSGGGGTPGPVTSSSITDSSASGRSVLTGTPAQGRTALQLGAAAILAVGVTGGVASYDDNRFTLAAQAATTATLSGLTSSLAHVAVRTDPPPAWATFKGDNNSLLVNLNETPSYVWPGGGDYACVSAITGAVRLPPEAKNNLINGGPAIIIAAGVSGIALSDGDTNVSVGVYGSGGINIEQGRSWGSNFTLANFAKRGITPSPGFNGQLIVSELDLVLKRPPGGWAGTNAYGTSTVLSLDYAPDGGLIAHHISAVDIGTRVGWKVGISTDQGSCLEFAQIHTSKYPGQGASGSQSLHFISTLGNGPDQYRHGFLALAPDGGFIVQPDYFVGTGQFTVANSNLSQACTMHPSNGFSGPSLYVSGSITAGGNGGISGNLAVGGLIQAPLLSVSGTANFNGDVNINGGLLTAPRIKFQGVDVQLCAPGPIPNGFKGLMIAG